MTRIIITSGIFVIKLYIRKKYFSTQFPRLNRIFFANNHYPFKSERIKIDLSDTFYVLKKCKICKINKFNLWRIYISLAEKRATLFFFFFFPRFLVNFKI